jgi:hypothetical protein
MIRECANARAGPFSGERAAFGPTFFIFGKRRKFYDQPAFAQALFSGAILINLKSLTLTLVRVRLASIGLWRSRLFASRAVVVHLESSSLNIPPMGLLA